MPDYDPDELLTVEQIATRFGCEVGTVHSWRHRGHMPEPDERVGKRLLRWRWSTIEGIPIVRRHIGRPQAGGET